jgi:putative transposase
MSRAERVGLVERGSGELSLSAQAELMGLNRSGLYYRPLEPSLEEIALKHRIDELYTQHPIYGSRKLTAQLRRDGLIINRKAVQRHMREMGIAGICPGPNLSRRNLQHRVYPYLLRDIVASYPNHIWGIDITYIRMHRGWVYLVAILDWFSRYVVAWELDLTLELGFVLAAVDRAFASAIPDILNSDQGSHFTSQEYIGQLQAQGVRISMDGKNRALDNVFTERLWRTVKYEEVYIQDYDSPRSAREGIERYLTFYNHERLHQSLGYRTPYEVYTAKSATALTPSTAPATPAAAILSDRQGGESSFEAPS